MVDRSAPTIRIQTSPFVEIELDEPEAGEQGEIRVTGIRVVRPTAEQLARFRAAVDALWGER